MNKQAHTGQAVLELLVEAVEQTWTSVDAWREQSAVAEPLFTQGLIRLEQQAEAPLWQDPAAGRERVLEMGKQVRAELERVLAEMEPVLSLVLLTGLSASYRRGYTRSRLAIALGLMEEQVMEKESLAMESLQKIVTEETPLLHALLQEEQGLQTDVLTTENPSALLQAARLHPDFDLRAHMSPELELRIRQAYHRHGLQDRSLTTNLFTKEEHFAVALVGERMLLETHGGKEASER
ncbi:MAG TPA: hypothetical protein VFV52_14265 [Bacilli bacterium]|nr:hypothetical protein [Bacilli bacterium]